MMESCPGATNWQEVSKLKRPGMLMATSFQSIAHGSDGAMYFQMRKSRGAEEKFHGAVLDHYDGNDTRTFRDVCETGVMLEAVGSVSGSVTTAKAAVVFDWENRWAVEGAKGPRNAGMYYRESVEKSYRALRHMGLNVDIVDQSCELDAYQFVAAPMVYLFREGFAGKVRSFVEAGGTFVLTYWSGVVDENDCCFLGGTPHDLMDVFGLRSEEIDALYDWEENEICQPTDVKYEGMQDSYICKYLCQLVKPTTAKTLMAYGKDFYAGSPALLVNHYGKGKAYYVCADVCQEFYDDLYGKVAAEAGVCGFSGQKLPGGLELTCRETEDRIYYFAQNFSNEEVPLNLPDGEVLFGDGSSMLKPLGNLVLFVKKQ